MYRRDFDRCIGADVGRRAGTFCRSVDPNIYAMAEHWVYHGRVGAAAWFNARFVAQALPTALFY